MSKPRKGSKADLGPLSEDPRAVRARARRQRRKLEAAKALLQEARKKERNPKPETSTEPTTESPTPIQPQTPPSSQEFFESRPDAATTPTPKAPELKVKWGEIIDGEIVYPIHTAQEKVLMSNARWTAAIAGTGGGKTALGPLWVLKKLNKLIEDIESGKRDKFREPILGLVVAPTYQVMSRATAPTLVRMLAGTEFEGKYIESKSRYLLPNDLGIIWLLSADNPQGLEGGQFDFGWLDEGGQLKYDAWVAIQGRLGQKQAPCLITTTPYGHNWLYHQFYKRGKAGDKDYYYVQWSSKLNPAYPEEEYNRAKKTMAAQRAAMRYDGQFVRMAGLVYPDIAGCIVKPFRLPDGEWFGGIDWGWNDPFAGLCAVLTDDDVLWVWYERYKRFTPIAEHAAKLPPALAWFADPSRPENLRELRAAGHTVRKAQNEILVGVDAVNARIYTGRLKISETCKALIAETEEYRYPEKDDEIIGDKPIDEFNHACDALRYLVTGVDRGRVGLPDSESATRDAISNSEGKGISLAGVGGPGMDSKKE